MKGRVIAGVLLALVLACGFSGCSNESDLQKKYDEGHKDGVRDGYQDGYDDGINGRPRRYSTQVQNNYVNVVVYVCAALAVIIFLYWMLYIYGHYSDTVGLLQQADSGAFYEGVWPKLLITLATICLLFLLVPSDRLVRLSLYLRAKLTHQYLVVFAGTLISFSTVLAITKTTAIKRSRLKTISQWIWAVLFPIIIFEMIGSFTKVQGLDFEYANETLLLQAGMLIGPLSLLSIQRLVRQIYRLT